MANEVGLYITFWAAPGKIDALVDALRPMLAVAAEEKGTLVYQMHRVSGALEGVSVYEIYRDQAAQQQHGESTAVELLKSKLAGLLGAPPERFDLVPLVGGKGSAKNI